MTDIEIANNSKKINIIKIADKLNINSEDVELYGKYKAKLNIKDKTDKLGKLILVTAINPTPFGEGKTTVTIGLIDALNKLKQNTIGALREPSLGPVFGLKGGATGGGYSQVVPMEDINLHFTGDIHAITSANNLLSALIDNHIYQGNKLKIKTVVWKRCLDLNDRILRNINIGYSKSNPNGIRMDHFDITVASEIMAILCLSKDMDDLKSRLGKIIIGYDNNDNEITAKDLNAVGAMAVLLKDALKPNLVQTLENNPVLIHGGPFANIAHGCNSVIATNLGLHLADYCITEAGFGADLGAEKFLDIKTRLLPKVPDAVVLVATIKSLKYHGGMNIEHISEENIDFLKLGIKNLFKHINNLTNIYNLNVIVAINKFKTDTLKEINYIITELNKKNVEYSINESWEKGSEGSIDLAKKIIKISTSLTNFNYCYDLKDSVEEKIKKVVTKIYGATDIEYSKEAYNKLLDIKDKYNNLPICIAKTPFSFSDDAKNLLCNKDFTFHITDLQVKTGAGFIVILAGNIFTMPGLPKVPAAENINIENDKIVGLF